MTLLDDNAAAQRHARLLAALRKMNAARRDACPRHLAAGDALQEPAVFSWFWPLEESTSGRS